MRKYQWIALGVLIGFIVAMAGSGLTVVRAQMQGPSPAEAQAALKQEQAVLDQMNTQMMQMQHDMSAAHGMTMTPTEKAMQKELDEMASMIKMLWQANTDLTKAMQMMQGAQNK